MDTAAQHFTRFAMSGDPSDLLRGLGDAATAATPIAMLAEFRAVSSVTTPVADLGTDIAAAGNGGLSAADEANIVYRVIRAEENPAVGLVAKNPAATYTAEGHIINGSRPDWASQFISTTKNLSVAESWAARTGNRIVGIDLARVNGSVLDFSTGAGLRGITAQNFARASAEVLIEGNIPTDAILWVR